MCHTHAAQDFDGCKAEVHEDLVAELAHFAQEAAEAGGGEGVRGGGRGKNLLKAAALGNTRAGI